MATSRLANQTHHRYDFPRTCAIPWTLAIHWTLTIHGTPALPRTIALPGTLIIYRTVWGTFGNGEIQINQIYIAKNAQQRDKTRYWSAYNPTLGARTHKLSPGIAEYPRFSDPPSNMLSIIWIYKKATIKIKMAGPLRVLWHAIMQTNAALKARK